MCDDSGYKSQKQVTFTPLEIQLEGADFKNEFQKCFGGTQRSWKKLVKPADSVASPVKGMAVAAKNKNLKVRQAIPKILYLITGGRILNLTYQGDNGLRLKVL